MIVIVVKQPVRSKYVEEWSSLVEEFATATRSEPGCISFEYSRSLDNPNEIVLVEVFEDEEAGKRHVESEHFKKATQQLPKWLAAAPSIIHINGVSEGWTGVAEIPSDA